MVRRLGLAALVVAFVACLAPASRVPAAPPGGSISPIPNLEDQLFDFEVEYLTFDTNPVGEWRYLHTFDTRDAAKLSKEHCNANGVAARYVRVDQPAASNSNTGGGASNVNFEDMLYDFQMEYFDYAEWDWRLYPVEFSTRDQAEFVSEYAQEVLGTPARIIRISVF